jgi:hypothetical protein
MINGFTSDTDVPAWPMHSELQQRAIMLKAVISFIPSHRQMLLKAFGVLYLAPKTMHNYLPVQ